MSKLVGALLLELADDVPDVPELETVKTDLGAAAKMYENGKKKDLGLRFYLAVRSLLQELERAEKAAGKSKAALAGAQQSGTGELVTVSPPEARFQSAGE